MKKKVNIQAVKDDDFMGFEASGHGLKTCYGKSPSETLDTFVGFNNLTEDLEVEINYRFMRMD